MACHNRREITLAALRGLKDQDAAEVLVSVVLFDDGSTDGTREEVRENFPEIEILFGDGSLYWSRSMAVAQAAALRQAKPDYLCWLNDDVELTAGAIEHLLTVAASNARSVIVGACVSAVSGKVTYAGFKRLSRRPKHLARILPASKAVEVDTFNGNVILVPELVYRRLGAIDSSFTHSLGDLDYGFRVVGQGFKNILAPVPVGLCERNHPRGTWRDENYPLAARLRYLKGPKGMPLGPELHLYRRHGGPLGLIYLLATYATTVGGIVWSSLVGGRAAAGQKSKLSPTNELTSPTNLKERP